MTGTNDHERPDAARRMRPRLRHRIPVRIRHYWKTAAVAGAALLALVLVFGDARVRPYITSQLATADTVTNNIAGEGDLFDGGGHSIEVTYNQAEYEDMMATFRDEGEKEFISADITIDGTMLDDVGLRLKGNSTLMSLRDDGGGMPQRGQQNQDQQGQAAQEGQGQQGGGPGAVSLSEDEPEKLPWLISFEEFQEGRAYQGHTEITLRPATATSDTALNEALALDLTAADGQTTQDYGFTSFTINGGEETPRLVLDSPDAAWAASYGEGVLYKGRAGGSFEYLGDDPTDYEEAFNQINGEGAYDLQPVMSLLEFVDQASDEEFAADLDKHLDVDSFARYLALQDLMSNSDAMDGPGNNYYLWYDTGQERFTVLSWDLNLSFGGMGEMMGDGQMPQGGQAPEDMPEPPEGMQMPGNGETPQGGQGPEGGEGGQEGGRGGMGGSSALADRFMANEDFAKLYEQAYADMYADLVESGKAASRLEQAASRAQATGDDGAAQAQQQLAEQVEGIAATPPEDPQGQTDQQTPQNGQDGQAQSPQAQNDTA
ncbi:spore coat protein CotH [Lipingzhangella halophila]|uniref:Spore coat protein CotH n=1 Tax=Lipingzhangella halophila TaxID=1783352 RepID=A0A7W7RFY5_9ACTN|nr:CotH kinase family protein [Lipingzhangella halophila]MBB4931281.1 spore coat protein CotH [Lipingzhangella halophila]